MTVGELIAALQEVDADALVTVECEHQGEGTFTHVVYAGSDLVASW